MKTTPLFRIPLALLAALSVPLPARADDALVYVQTRSASIQSEPKLLSRTTKKLSYGDALSVISKENGWLKVKTPDRAEGYIHLSAISTQKLTLAGSKTGNTKVSDSDISLAGKGFTPEVEKQLASQNQSLNFKAVDAMERLTVTPEQTRAFIKGGKLNQDAL